jgi:hypothetical protein
MMPKVVRFAKDDEPVPISPAHTLRLAKAAYSALCNNNPEAGKQLIGLQISYLKGEEEKEDPAS